MTGRIYTVPLPEATTPQDRESLAKQLAQQGVLGGESVVDALSTESADLSLSGQYAYGRYYSELLATELEELANSQLSGLPLYDGDTGRAGFYEIASANVEPVHAGGRDIWEWELSLTKKGTRKTHFRGLELSLSEPTTPFGGTEDKPVAIPTEASLVRVLSSRSSPETRLSASPDQTLTGANGDVDLFSPPPVIDAVFVYDAPKGTQPPVDVHVYDTRGREQKFITADNGRVRAWQAVFDTAHEFNPGAEAVLSNGFLRLRLNEPDPGAPTASLSAERYDAGAGAWQAVDLPSFGDGDVDTEWVPVDVDITRIGQASAEGVVTFEAIDGANDGDTFRFDVRLFRGRDRALFTIPPSEEGPVPTALFNRLEPIASDRVIDLGVEQTLIERQEVR